MAGMARRAFLIGSAALAGGVAFGVWQVRRDPANPLLDRLPDGAAALTPYVLITRDAVTLITPRAEVGQGATHLQALLIAEELDVDLADVRLDNGPASPAYYNAALLADVLGPLSQGNGAVVQAKRVAGATVAKLMGLHITGGSSTVRDSWEKLRHAGAVARETLKLAASQDTGVAVADLTTDRGAVVLPDGRRIAYTALAARAATLDPVTDVVLRSPDQWRLIGKPLPHPDMVAKSTGTFAYGIDVALPDMIHAAVRVNPALGGGIRSFDAAAARLMRGVIDVVAVTDGFAVLADNTWRAFQAADAVVADWGPAPYPETTAALAQVLADSFTPDRQDSRPRDEGDPDSAAGDVITADYAVPYLAHAPLEPMTATAQLKDGRLTLWLSTQVPRFAVAAAATAAGVDPDAVTLHVLPAGGSFGRRLETDYAAQVGELARAAGGRPVKMTRSREDDMAQSYPRPMVLARGRAVVAGGQVQAFSLDIAGTSVSGSQGARWGLPQGGADASLIDGAGDQPFAVPHIRVTAYRAPDMVPVSSWRSVGASGNGFFHESLLDEAIHAAGADPLAERLRLVTDPASRRVLETVGQMAGWGSTLAPGRGRGLAFVMSFGVPVAEVVEVSMTPAGLRIDKVFVALEVGRIVDPVNFENQVQGGVVWGLGHAMYGELTYAKGAVEQTNFDSYPSLRLPQCPDIVVQGLQSDGPIRGAGEPPVPPAAPALAAAIFAATGQRIRSLPLARAVRFA